MKNNVFNLLKKIIYLIVVGVIVIFILNLVMKNNYMTSQQKLIEYNFENVGKLVTQEWFGTIIKDTEKERKLFNEISIPLTKSRLIFSSDVKVTAGIDFEKIDYDIINEDSVKISLPKAEIFDSFELKDTIKVYLDDESIFSNINEYERVNLRNEIIKEGKQKALALGILDNAKINAKKIIEQMIKKDNSNINIEWVEKN